MSAMRTVLLIAAGALAASGATLERLSLDEMIRKSTEIVRAKIVSSHGLQSGPVIYTAWRIQVLERLKGAGPAPLEMVVPGGRYGALRQTFSGTPKLVEGSEYVLFLWRGRNGVNQVVGLSQGVLDLKLDQKGEPVAFRAASAESMLDPVTGRSVSDEPLVMGWSEMRRRVRQVLGERE